MNVAVIINSGAGRQFSPTANSQALRDAFAKWNIKARFHDIDSQEMVPVVRQAAASQVDAVVVVGGDGTISAAAGVLAGTDMPLGVIPAGTFNHFAKDAQIPLHPQQAVQLIAEGSVQRIDTAEVNGHIFINNSSVGLYPRAVRFRDRYLRMFGGSKSVAMVLAWFSACSRFPLLTISLQADDRNMIRTTPFVFVGNNQYQLDLFTLGSRTDMTGGNLSLYIANNGRRIRMVGMAMLALLHKKSRQANFDLHLVKEVRLDTVMRNVHVALDGEIVYMTPPLYYRIRPRDLDVILPSMST